MFNIKKQYIAALLAGFALTATLTACSTPATSADPAAKPATSEQAPAAVEEEPATNDLIKPFGEVVTYEDGVSISVALVGPFTPGEYAIVGGADETPTVFKVVITNNSDEPLEPAAIPQANSGGKPATYIADTGNAEYGDLGLFPTTTLLPGQTLEWYAAFGVVDPADVTLEITPSSFTYDNAIFTNTL